MKKNVMMRLASFLLVAVLVSTSAISGTYAKYVTSGNASDTARVAKFGVEVEPNGQLFLKIYEKTDGSFTLAEDTVVTSDEWKVVAPGTDHSMTKVHLTGKPEVAVRVSYQATFEIENWKLPDSSEYFPVYFTINNETYGTVDCQVTLDHQYPDLTSLIDAMTNVVLAYHKDYKANTDLSTIYAMDDNALEISWAWPFSTSEANDIKDTDLGDAAAVAGAGDELTIKVAVKTTVTQID